MSDDRYKIVMWLDNVQHIFNDILKDDTKQTLTIREIKHLILNKNIYINNMNDFYEAFQNERKCSIQEAKNRTKLLFEYLQREVSFLSGLYEANVVSQIMECNLANNALMSIKINEINQLEYKVRLLSGDYSDINVRGWVLFKLSNIILGTKDYRPEDTVYSGRKDYRQMIDRICQKYKIENDIRLNEKLDNFFELLKTDNVTLMDIEQQNINAIMCLYDDTVDLIDLYDNNIEDALIFLRKSVFAERDRRVSCDMTDSCHIETRICNLKEIINSIEYGLKWHEEPEEYDDDQENEYEEEDEEVENDKSEDYEEPKEETGGVFGVYTRIQCQPGDDEEDDNEVEEENDKSGDDEDGKE